MATIVGIDPGRTNFAVVDLSSTLAVRSVSMIKHTIKSSKGIDAHNQMKKFLKEVVPLLKGADRIVAERYVNRGVRSTSNEHVNMMLGGLVTTYPIEMLVSATWKNRANKAFDLRLYYPCCAVPPHVVDAALIAMYPNLDLGFNDLRDLCRQLEKKWSGRLRAIRDRKNRVKLLRQSIEERQ